MSPEQLEPEKNEKRLSASAIYTRRLGAQGEWSTTLAWGRRRSGEDQALNAYAVESAWRPTDAWTLFARLEREKNDELAVSAPRAGTAYEVGKTSLGVIRDFRLTGHLKIGVGALYALNIVPGELAPSYGRTDPAGAMAFLRLKSD